MLTDNGAVTQANFAGRQGITMQGAVPQIAKGDLAVSAITLALERLLFGRQAIQFKDIT